MYKILAVMTASAAFVSGMLSGMDSISSAQSETVAFGNYEISGSGGTLSL